MARKLIPNALFSKDEMKASKLHPSCYKGDGLPVGSRVLSPLGRKDNGTTMAQLQVKNKTHINRSCKDFTAPLCTAMPGSRWLCANSWIPEKPRRKTGTRYCSHVRAACHQLFNHAVGSGARGGQRPESHDRLPRLASSDPPWRVRYHSQKHPSLCPDGPRRG